MKICPQCGHLEDNKDYCRICNRCLTYEAALTPEQEERAKEPPFNRYKLLYHLKQISVPGAGLVLSLLLMVVYRLLTGRLLLPCAAAAVFLGLASLALGFLEWPIVRRLLSNRGEKTEYTKTAQRVQLIKIFLTFAAVLLAGTACAV